MDSFELNKIAGAVLATGLLVMALSITSEMIYEPEDLRENGYVIAVDETEGEGAAEESVAAVAPIAVRLQSADASAGETAARKCQACHTFEEGGAAKVGPNLYDIVGAEAAHMPGFNYSDTLMEMSAEGMTWTFEELDDFLANPRADMPGTLMAFAGLRRPEERADVIAYLRTLSDSPVPLPEPPAEAAAEGEAATEEGEAATGGDPSAEAEETPSTELEGASDAMQTETGSDGSAESGDATGEPQSAGTETDAVSAPQTEGAVAPDATPTESDSDGSVPMGDAADEPPAAPETEAPQQPLAPITEPAQ